VIFKFGGHLDCFRSIDYLAPLGNAELTKQEVTNQFDEFSYEKNRLFTAKKKGKRKST
jgi:hypothetical protein